MSTEGSPDFSHLALFETEHWKVGMHPKQTYLGRGVSELKRELADPLECTPSEHQELWGETLPKFQKLIVEAFAPVRINYGHMANERKQVHWHIVPRYDDPTTRTFSDVEFTDPKPGHNYSPHPEVPVDFTDEKLAELVAELRTRLSK